METVFAILAFSGYFLLGCYLTRWLVTKVVPEDVILEFTPGGFDFYFLTVVTLWPLLVPLSIWYWHSIDPR